MSGFRAHVDLSFDEARKIAADWAALPPELRPLAEALGTTLAADVAALTHLPSFRSSLMDGWAVSGSGPWTLTPGRVLAGHEPSPLGGAQAVEIATGAMVPTGADAVLCREDGDATDGTLTGSLAAVPHLVERGSECVPGDLLWPAGSPVTPPVVGLAAAAGHDELRVRRRPRVALLVLGDELLTEGLPGQGRVRDSLGPQLGGWASSVGGDLVSLDRVPDDLDATIAALAVEADVVISTGGTAAGPVDHVHAALRAAGAEVLVDGVQVRPGHPMMLARLADGRPFVGIPGNPLSACLTVLTLLAPVIHALTGGTPRELATLRLGEDLHGRDPDSRLVPVTVGEEGARAVPHIGSTMLRGLALAQAVVVLPPEGGRAGDTVRAFHLPWTLT